MTDDGDGRTARPPGRAGRTDAPVAGAAPQRVADLLHTFSPASVRRRRVARPDGPRTIVPLLTLPDEGTTPLDPGRIDDARARLKAAAEASAATAQPSPAPPADVDPTSFDAARSRLRQGRPRGPQPPRG